MIWLLLHTSVSFFFLGLVDFLLPISETVACVFPCAHIHRDNAAPVFLPQHSLLHTILQWAVEGIALGIAALTGGSVDGCHVDSALSSRLVALTAAVVGCRAG